MFNIAKQSTLQFLFILSVKSPLDIARFVFYSVIIAAIKLYTAQRARALELFLRDSLLFQGADASRM